MDVRNCRRCNKVFQYRGSAICANCIEQEEQDFQKVRQYIIDHPNVTTVEVSEATDVELKVITRFLREGRLEFEDNTFADGGLICDKCGQSIRSGRYCERCLQNMQQDFRRVSEDMGGGSATEVKPVRNQDVVHTFETIVKKK